MQELLADQAQLLMSDALAVRDGLYPPMEEETGSPLRHLFRVRRMLADLPDALERRAAADASTAKAQAAAAGVPEYYAQDFHFQTGGYLSEDLGEPLRHPGRDAVHGGRPGRCGGRR